MNSKRKADLQRRLAMASVPKPPSGLADRIKNEIPADLGRMTAIRRPARWGGVPMRIAASLILVVSSLYLGIRLLSHTPAEISARRPATIDESPALRKSSAIAPAEAQAQNALAAKPKAVSPAALTTPMQEAAPGRTSSAAEPAVRLAESAPRRDIAADAKKEDKDLDKGRGAASESTIAYAPAPAAPLSLSVAPAPPAAVAEAKAMRQASQISRDEAAATAKVAAAERSAAVDAVVGGVVGAATPPARTMNITANAALAGGARSGVVTASIARSRFGISTDPLAFERVKEAIERGERPADVNLEALVNYFAGRAEEPVAELTVNLEGSPAPVAFHELTRLVRVSIDAPIPAAGAAKTIATDARLAVKFDSGAVASHRLIGGEQVSSITEAALFENTSVTALYEVQLKPGLRKRQAVATVQLRYRDAAGRERVIPRMLRVGDFAQAWADASRRQRLTSLGAIWGETLKYDTSGTDVARRAEELAKQEPRDSKARELAQLATASSRLRSSGSTGSGR
jgi:hypothetical protein